MLKKRGQDRSAVALRRQLVADLGTGVLAREIRKIERAIARHERKPVTARWSLGLQNLLQKKTALRLIDESLGLSKEAVIAPFPMRFHSVRRCELR